MGWKLRAEERGGQIGEEKRDKRGEERKD